ncbi:hypothetical protein HAX54_005323, partial [Datura stramonium]|nr:hypothetical protein [Datura stramonium]
KEDLVSIQEEIEEIGMTPTMNSEEEPEEPDLMSTQIRQLKKIAKRHKQKTESIK